MAIPLRHHGLSVHTRPASGLLLLTVLAPLTGGCAAPSRAPGCGSPAVLDFLDAQDQATDLSHLGLVRRSVRQSPGPTADSASCLVQERLRGTPPGRPSWRWQSYAVRRVGEGWRLTLPARPWR